MNAGRIIAAVKDLADRPIAELRQIASSSDSGSQYAADQEFGQFSRGELIYWILHRDYTEEGAE
jgi:hypothetical protein